MRKIILNLIKERKQERENITNSNLSILEIEQKVNSLNYEIKALEFKLTTLA